PGITVVDAIDGALPEGGGCWATPGNAAEWYSYTPTVTQLITISTAIDENPFDNDVYDTRLSVYTGSCDALVCENGNDDISDTDYRSELQFVVIANQTYYFTFDDRWLDTGFSFSLVVDETYTADCSVTLPFTEDFESIGDFYGCYTRFDQDGNGASFIQESAEFGTFATNSPNADDDKNDWLFSPAIPVQANGTYTVSVKFNGADSQTASANESFDVVWTDAPDPATNNQTVVGSYSDIVFNGTSLDDIEAQATVETTTPYTPGVAGNRYVGFHATSLVGGAFLLLFEYTVTESLGTNDAAQNVISMYPNPTKSMLTLVQNSNIESVQVFDLLGKNVMNQTVNATTAQLNVTELASGTYVIKTQSANGTQVSKFIKS
ncbi:MAG: T9SS type A sorting domain-containing protein, partial [Chitinophagaceae bacterium]